MTPQDIALVQQSFTLVAPNREAVAAAFYDRLFAIDPALKPLFRGDLRSQGIKLMGALTLVVTQLNRLETILDDVKALARRHVGYGVTDQHYATVGQALLDTLQSGLGEAFTPELRGAWTRAYTLLSGAMIAAAAETGAPA
jgi:hemoglobin-like flavoprotein